MYDIDWKDTAIKHIARHHVVKYEVEEGINQVRVITARDMIPKEKTKYKKMKGGKK